MQVVGLVCNEHVACATDTPLNRDRCRAPGGPRVSDDQPMGSQPRVSGNYSQPADVQKREGRPGSVRLARSHLEPMICQDSTNPPVVLSNQVRAKGQMSRHCPTGTTPRFALRLRIADTANSANFGNSIHRQQFIAPEQTSL